MGTVVAHLTSQNVICHIKSCDQDDYYYQRSKCRKLPLDFPSLPLNDAGGVTKTIPNTRLLSRRSSDESLTVDEEKRTGTSAEQNSVYAPASLHSSEENVA